MTLEEFNRSGLGNQHCKFVMSCGIKISGIIASFFQDQPNTYHYVASNNIDEVYECRAEKNWESLKHLALLVDFEDIVHAERLY